MNRSLQAPDVGKLKTLAEKYARMVSDGRVLSNRATLDAIDERVQQLLERIDVNEAPDRLQNLHLLWEEFKLARQRKNETDVIVTIRRLDGEFDKAYHDYAAWSQLMEVFDLRRKMVDSEVRVIKEIKAMLTAEDAYKLVAKLQAVCIRVVDDPKKLRLIQQGFSRIIGEQENPRPISISDEDIVEYDEEAEDG